MHNICWTEQVLLEYQAAARRSKGSISTLSCGDFHLAISQSDPVEQEKAWSLGGGERGEGQG